MKKRSFNNHPTQEKSSAVEPTEKKQEDIGVKKDAETEKSSDILGFLRFKGLIPALFFAIILYWGLNHYDVVASIADKTLSLFSPLIAGAAIAFVINTVLFPTEKLWKRMFGKIRSEKVAGIIGKLKRPICLVISTLAVAGLLFLVLFLVIPELVDTVAVFIDKAPAFLDKAKALLGELSLILEKYDIVLPEMTFDTSKVISLLETFVTKKWQSLFNTTVGITTSIFSTVFNMVLAFVFAFYILACKEQIIIRLKRVVYALFSEKKADSTVRIAYLSANTFNNFISGQFIEAVIIGVLCFIGMTIFRIPFAPVISVLVGVTALIPLFGAFIGTAVGAVMILSVDFYKALWFVIFIIVLQQLESNLIYPRIVGKSVGLPGILVLCAVTVGGGLFGFVGILLSVPVCSVFYCIFNEYIGEKLKHKSSSVREKAETDRDTRKEQNVTKK